MSTTRTGWRMVGPGRLERFEEPLAEPPPGWVTVEVIGCGVCHTDLSYLYGGVATAKKGAIVLGHEIVGRVADSDRVVVVPAVAPCGECRACRRGRPTACAHGLMPGNHHDGGFASHVQVPSRFLCTVPQIPHLDPSSLWRLAAIADAVTTPLQAIMRSQLAAGDVAIVVGAGGVGGFLVEIARAHGATVVALDVDAAKVARAMARGAVIGVDVRGLEPRAVKKDLAARLAPLGHDADGWHVFECSGTAAGQLLAFGLLGRGGTLGVVGYSAEAIPLRLSNLMALDAEAYGNWGADPALYPEALRLGLDGKIDLDGAVERHPLDDAPAVLAAVHEGKLGRRAVLVPHA